MFDRIFPFCDNELCAYVYVCMCVRLLTRPCMYVSVRVCEWMSISVCWFTYRELKLYNSPTEIDECNTILYTQMLK